MNIYHYDIAVIQWIASCYKNHMTTLVKALWRIHVTSLITSVSAMRFLIKTMFILKVKNLVLKDHMINGILHEWSFHMKLSPKARFINFI